jgi:HTH-type transcriptional regulator, sugar sensing transcriptional regulator
MTTDDEFTRRLISFGLSEKEAQIYLHLLKYGPKTPSPLAKSLKTYREDVHRTLSALIEKGMVRPSLDAPTTYTAVDVDSALETALKKRESELREMEEKKRELHELSQQQRFPPAPDVSTFKIIKSIKELVAVGISLVNSAQDEWLIATPAFLTVVASLFGVNEAAYDFIKRGGKVRVIVDISYQVIEPVQEMMAIGEDVRHIDRHGIMFVVFDRKISISAINAEVKRISLNEPVSGLWTDDPAYAQYLTSTFEMLWRQSIPAEQRIQELLKQGPPLDAK